MADPFLDPRAAGAAPAVVVGTMNFGKRTPEAEAHRIVARALERGATFFDTANVYVQGVSEEILGRALRGRKDARIATKCGIGNEKGPAEGLAPATVTRALDESLRRLGVEQVALYYLHKPDPLTPFAATLEALERARRAGKIGAFALSNFASWQILEWQTLCAKSGVPGPRVAQLIYNLLVRQLEVEYFAFARKHPIHTTIYNPLAGGMLAGTVERGRDPEKGSRFGDSKMYRGRYLSKRFFDLAETYAGLAGAEGKTPVQLAYAFCASQPGVDSILAGPGTVEQLDAALAGCAVALAPEALSKIDEIHRAYLGTEVTYAR